LKLESVPLITQLKALESRASHNNLSVGEIFNILGTEGHYVFIFFLVLPFLQPVPMLGLSAPFGVLIAVVAVFAYLNKLPWIPEKWKTKSVPIQTVRQIVIGAEKILNKLSVIFKTRWPQFFKGPFRFINMLIIVINAILLALPIPVPFANAVPAWGILFQALANIEDDGVLVLVSYVQCVLCFFYFFVLAKGVETGLEFLWQR
jgi:hypothetical protein